MSLKYCPECKEFQNTWHFASTSHEPGPYPSRLSPELIKSRKEQSEYIKELATDLHTIYLDTESVRKEIEYLQHLRSKAIEELKASGYQITANPIK